RLIDTGRYDETFVRRWTNAPLLVRSDNDLFLRAGDLTTSRVCAAPDAFVIWDEVARAPRTYDTTHALSHDAANHAALRGEFIVMA
ncbi:hypothetical protein ACPWSH_25765, partial [Pandoraea pneumonica]|uniref:hypothetical protein n=1 Tax=Pandoraea pneumonica TaxID=2508299 RepID=UPI003CEFFDF0